ncbi:unnamed protein product [Pedinophyceae sp. YPF-701]|nr:unnamed protein product [Pedinophyceae sp. YPF-701]
MLYRSKQRGFLELDLLVGKWAERNLDELPEDELIDMENLLAEENPDLWKWLSSQSPAPQDVLHNRVFKRIKAEVDADLSKHDPATRAARGAEWVRGWEDVKRWRNEGNQ